MSGTRRFLGGLRERIAGVDDANRPTPSYVYVSTTCLLCETTYYDDIGHSCRPELKTQRMLQEVLDLLRSRDSETQKGGQE